MKKITSIKIEKLFGTFDYEIDFEKNEGFTILTAPNGYGKSTILNIIRAAAVGNFCYFAGLKFESIEMLFRGTQWDEWRSKMEEEELSEEAIANLKKTPKITRLTVVKVPREIVPDVEEGEEQGDLFELRNREPFECIYTVDDVVNHFSDLDIDKAVDEIVANIPSLKPMYMFETENGSRLWRDRRDGEVLDLAGVYRRYAYHFRKFFNWAFPLQRQLNFNVNFISTNRLYEEEDDRPTISRFRSSRMDVDDEIEKSHLLKIFEIGKDLERANRQCMREQLQVARKLESSFVERVVDVLNGENKRPSAEDLRKKINRKINAIRKIENSCYEFGITSKIKMNKELQIDDESALIMYDKYLEDVEKKLQTFNPLLKKLVILSNGLNELLELKKVTIDLSAFDNVLQIKDKQTDAQIPLHVLSSGEQHLIVLLGRLLFDNTDSDALVMMDEPEISFHPSWQEKFSKVLFDIQEKLKDELGNKRQFIIATHSPSFIGEHWDKTQDLSRLRGD